MCIRDSLYVLGIVERWKRESNEALKKLEELTGQTWDNPYKPENERFTLKLTDEERTTITNRINEGYYRPEAVQARKDEEKRKAYEKKRAEIINDCKKKQQKAENEKRVMLAVLDAGLSLRNVISVSYTHLDVYKRQSVGSPLIRLFNVSLSLPNSNACISEQ